MTDTRVWPDIAIPPGELLAETLESLGMSQAELARRTGRPVQAINEIVRGAKEITAETALQLERVLGVPAHIWIRLEADYRCNVARIQDRKRLADEVPLAEKYPYKDMVARGWVQSATEPVERVVELMRFFRVSSLRQLETRAVAVAWRRSSKVELSREALLVWLRQGERQAEGVDVESTFNKEVLQRKLPQLRSLTQEKPDVFEPAMRRHLAASGVILVFVPHLPKTGAQGATQWLVNRALIQLSVRYRWSDILWFSFFHELGHLLLHQRKGVFVNPESGEKSSDEREADRFAMDTLIPPDQYQRLCEGLSHPSAGAVVECARQLGISTGILVGRLQYEKRLPPSHLNHLRERLDLVKR